MKKSQVKNALTLALVSGAALAIVFTVVPKGGRQLDTGKMTSNPELKPVLLRNGKPPPRDAAFLLMRPADVARTPAATRFDTPLGSAQGALSYDAQPFLAWNTQRDRRHLGADLNGIGGMDSDIGDPVRATAAGRVVFAGEAGPGWGRMVIVAHALANGRRILQSVCAHLDHISVTAGIRVRRGEPLGTVGTGGGLYPAHLHFELRRSSSVNPAEGYHSTPLNRIDPTAFVAENRGASATLLNPAPRSQPAAFEFHNR